MMTRQIAGATAALWIAFAGPLAAQSQPVVVVELYTAQGCPSSPPADAYFATLLSNQNVIPLSLHVDYWDYIGWEDSFANPEFTDRQKAYARAEGRRTIYTPQFVVNGEGRIAGVEPAELDAQVRQQLRTGSPVTLWLERKGAVVVIRADANPPLGKAVQVQIVRYRPNEAVTIGQGENAGLTMTYYNIVTSWTSLGEWSGTGPLVMEATASGSDQVVVIVQDQGLGRILAAAKLN